jgi:hypothetical protein
VIAIIRNLAGRDTRRFTGILSAQIDCAVEAAAAARCACAGESSPGDALAAVSAIERRGDGLREQMEAALGASVVTPLDREDLFRLSHALDTLTDQVRDFARLLVALDFAALPSALPVLDAFTAASAEFSSAVCAVASDPARIAARAYAAMRAGNAIRVAHDEQIGILFRDEPDIRTLIAKRDAMRRLDVLGLRFEEAVRTLTSAAYKRAEA